METTMTISFDSKDHNVRNILESLINMGLIIERSKEKTQMTKAESDFKESFEEALTIKKKLSKGDRKGVRYVEDFLKEL